MSCLASFALTSLINSNSAYFDSGLPVYYRTQNFDEALVGEGISEMGFQVMPSIYSASGFFVTGTTDKEICPQPAVKLLTMKMIADAQQAGSALRVGARTFNISHSWVQSIQVAKGYDNPRQVFIDRSVVGFYHDGLLFQIVSYVHNDLYGGIIDWDVICNANDIK